MPMRNPPHPGDFVRYFCLEPGNLSIKEAAEGLGISRYMLSAIVNGKRPITAELAVRFAKAFGSTPRVWLAMQSSHDLWQAEARADKIKVRKFTYPEPVMKAT